MSGLRETPTAVLRGVPYLRHLAPDELDELVLGCQMRPVDPGARVFAEGERPEGVFLILSGRIRVVRSALDGREQVLHEEGPGATLAEIPVFDGEGCVGTAVAAETSTLLLIPGPLLLRTLARNPAAAMEAVKVLAARVRRFAALIEDLSLRPVSARLAKYLMREADRAGRVSIQLPPTREQLAAHIGTVREEVSRALSKLRRDGAIEIDDRTVRILSLQKLQAAAGE